MMMVRVNMAQLHLYTVIVYIIILLRTSVIQGQLRGPSNITRTAGETDVFFPCPYEFRPSPSLWRINGSVFSISTLPSVYSITPGGLVIHTVHRCLNQTSFQCIDTSDDSLNGQESSIGFLTVISTESCTGTDELDLYYMSTDTGTIELDHKRIKYGSNTTLAWDIFPPESCDTSHIISFPTCQETNIDINITTSDTEVTIQFDRLRISGMLADFNISSMAASSNSDSKAILPENFKIDVNETERLQLLLGNNNCTCVNLDQLEALSIAISNSNSSQIDTICPISPTPSPCYSPSKCKYFEGTPFFRVCVSSTSSEAYEMCFGNVTTQLNGTRMDFFTSKKEICSSDSTYYSARRYIRSFEILAMEGSANITADTKSEEICFSALQDCDLISFTTYNVTIVDLTENVIFRNESIPESTCVTIPNLSLSDCAPFHLLAQPTNDYIVFGSYSQMITTGGSSESDDVVCSCLQKNVQLSVHTSQDQSAITFHYNCSTTYVEPVYISLYVNFDNTSKYQNVTLCSEDSFSFSLSPDMFGVIEFSGYWVATNGTECQLLKSSHTIIVTPTIPPVDPTHRNTVTTIVGVIISLLAISIVVVVIVSVSVYMYRRNTLTYSINDSDSHAKADSLDEHDESKIGASDNASTTSQSRVSESDVDKSV